MDPLHSRANWRGKIFQQAEAFGMKSQQVLDILTLTKSAIKEELQAEIKNGQYKVVLQFLVDQSVRHGKNLLFDKIIQKVAARLILRLGIPGGLAVNIATLLVPVLLKGVSKKVLKNTDIQTWLTQINHSKIVPQINALKNFFKKDNNAAAA
ncbi:hypothetical protein HUW51_21820 [Adhaeribacter swui]|uniref:Uncharacterized protein n=1 Tax=Adhaeribacter swui TaxID=2086471 RepID=A0A7G7GDJ2_9BACT|nr:hypothetical protein [Adhaeribacter swui]QNF35226.1 hypothetical protein HUW51_21820 [Adhaeribacter swui]